MIMTIISLELSAILEMQNLVTILVISRLKITNGINSMIPSLILLTRTTSRANVLVGYFLPMMMIMIGINGKIVRVLISSFMRGREKTKFSWYWKILKRKMFCWQNYNSKKLLRIFKRRRKNKPANKLQLNHRNKVVKFHRIQKRKQNYWWNRRNLR